MKTNPSSRVTSPQVIDPSWGSEGATGMGKSRTGRRVRYHPVENAAQIIDSTCPARRVFIIFGGPQGHGGSLQSRFGRHCSDLKTTLKFPRPLNIDPSRCPGSRVNCYLQPYGSRVSCSRVSGCFARKRRQAAQDHSLRASDAHRA
jgi:hypothetical protein